MKPIAQPITPEKVFRIRGSSWGVRRSVVAETTSALTVFAWRMLIVLVYERNANGFDPRRLPVHGGPKVLELKRGTIRCMA
jgi:hypothetical protein